MDYLALDNCSNVINTFEHSTCSITLIGFYEFTVILGEKIKGKKK